MEENIFRKYWSRNVVVEPGSRLCSL
jgi:hypothetical protein